MSAIKDILNNAVLLDTEISEKNTNKKSKNTAFMHKLYCPIQYNNKTYIAKVSVEEFLSPSNDIERKAYHLQSIKIETADGRATNKIALASTPRSDAVSIDRVSQLFTLVKRLDKNFQPRESSKVVNDDGTPRRMYYTTYHSFGTSDAGEILKRIDTQNLLTALQKINEEAIGDLAEAVELYNKVNNTDFDGIIKPTFMNNIIASAL